MPSRTEPPRHAERALDPQHKTAESPTSPASVGWPVALTVIAILAVFFTLHAASSLFVPIAAAVLLSMLLAPPVQLLERLHVPRLAASAIVVAATVALIGAGLAALAGPAQSWIEKGPESLQKMEHRLFALRKPHEDATEQPQEAADAKTHGDGPQEVRVVQPALRDIVLSATPQAAASIISVTILVYFLLASGDVFLRKLVTEIPTLGDKKRAVEITRQIETDISFYLLSFTLVNVGLGVAMAVVTAVLGMPNPLLWGALVAVLNFVPYVGALASMAILAIVGIQTFDSLPLALAAPAILLILVGIAGEVITPFVLGRRLQLNPVAIFIAILLWGWLWGIVGVLLAVPLLASFKIICERVEPLHPIAEFLTI
ncbi:MAG: AI-2E family transporter [Rhodomicrobiaceae bacterium]